MFNFIKSDKLVNKISFINSLILILLVVFLASIFFYLVKQNIISLQVDEMEKNLEKTFVQVDKNIELCNMSMQIVLNNRQIKEFLSKVYENKNISLDELINFNKQELANIYSIINSNPYLYQIRLYKEDNTIPEIWPILYNKERLKRQDWYSENSFNNTKWVFNYTDKIFLHDTYLNEKKYLAALISPIKDVNNRNIGIIEISTPMNILFPEIYESLDNNLMIVFDNENVYYNKKLNIDTIEPYLEIVNNKVKNNTQLHPTVFVDNFGKEKVVIGYMYIKSLDVNLVKIKPLKDTLKEIEKIKNTFIIFGLILIILISFIMSGLIKLVLSRFNKIMDFIKQVQQGNLDIQVPDLGEDEVAQIGIQLNEMIIKIKELMEINLKREIAFKNTEIKALQSQINSHFIYNILEAIKMMAEIEGMYNISDSVTALARLLRYTMRWKSQTVTVKEEIDYIKNYITLLNLRYDYEIILSLKIPNIIFEQNIPKMCMQPIIENAILHGHDDNEEDINIYIKAILYPDYFYIEITDTGKGMNKVELEKLKNKILYGQEINNSKTHSNGIALKNINERLQFCYGEEYKLEIISKEHCYTKVRFKIPLIKDI